jgi:hypothetical protein
VDEQEHLDVPHTPMEALWQAFPPGETVPLEKLRRCSTVDAVDAPNGASPHWIPTSSSRAPVNAILVRRVIV